MRMKWIVPLAAVLLIVAACESTPEETAMSAGEGATVTSGVDTTSVDTAALDTTGPIPGTQEDLVQNVGDRVFFEFDSAVLTPDSRQVLERQAEWLKLFPEISLSVEGHCDERGTREYNLALGERRATAVREYLVALGIDARRINTISYGKERPYALGHDEDAWSLNRRGVTVVN